MYRANGSIFQLSLLCCNFSCYLLESALSLQTQQSHHLLVLTYCFYVLSFCRQHHHQWQNTIFFCWLFHLHSLITLYCLLAVPFPTSHCQTVTAQPHTYQRTSQMVPVPSQPSSQLNFFVLSAQLHYNCQQHPHFLLRTPIIMHWLVMSQ